MELGNAMSSLCVRCKWTCVAWLFIKLLHSLTVSPQPSPKCRTLSCHLSRLMSRLQTAGMAVNAEYQTSKLHLCVFFSRYILLAERNYITTKLKQLNGRGCLMAWWSRNMLYHLMTPFSDKGYNLKGTKDNQLIYYNLRARAPVTTNVQKHWAWI